MDKPTVITNHVPRRYISGDELTPKERKEFDYYSDQEIAFASFVRYKGWVYDIGEFILTDKKGELGRWHAYHGESAFSCILIYIPVNDNDHVVMGRAYW
jgi:hypothetical protein